MAQITPLTELVERLLSDPAQRAAYASDPSRYLADAGWDDADPADLAAGLDHVREALPIEQATRLTVPDDAANLEPAVLFERVVADAGTDGDADATMAFGSGAATGDVDASGAVDAAGVPDTPSDEPDGWDLLDTHEEPDGAFEGGVGHEFGIDDPTSDPTFDEEPDSGAELDGLD